MRDILVILNPAARSERAGKTWKKIDTFRGAKVKLTKAPGDARALAEWGVGQGFGTIVAAGGDGTINEVVNGLAGTEAALGVLPIGTMNVFSKEHDLPEKLDKAWAVIRAGNLREIDLLAANGTHFIQLAGVGLDAQVVKETTWESKKNLGPLSYLISAAQIAARTPPKLAVEAGGRISEGSFVLIGNGRYYGAKITLFPKARVDDGLLDVLIFKNIGYLDIAKYLAGVLVGRHTGMDGVEYFQVSEATVRSEEDVPVEVDGELSGALPVTFRVAGKLQLCVP